MSSGARQWWFRAGAIILPMVSTLILMGQSFHPLSVEPTTVTIVEARTRAHREPTSKSKMRGMLQRGTRLPVLDRSEGDGCSGHEWFRVYDDAWVCGRDVALSFDPPAASPWPPVRRDSHTPWPYAFLQESAVEYRWNKLGWLDEIREIFKGFGFAVEGTVTIDEQRFYRTPEGNLIPASAARYTSRVTEFEGRILENGAPWPVGFVNEKTAWVYASAAAGEKDRVRQLVRFDSFEVLGRSDTTPLFFRIGDRAWIAAKDVRVTTSAPRPADVAPDEKWIDVDVEQQIVTALRGDVPVYVTLASTGRKGPSATVKGEFRIWVKVAAIAMDNTDEEQEGDTDSDTAAPERHLYSLQDVPWTQFFHENYALHAVYWHNGFGNRRSHGCVNLSPKDARWFWEWTDPVIPDGWWSIYTSDNEKGTLVRVR